MRGELPQRASTRLKGFDYAQSGSYFITFCIKDKHCLLGKVVGGEIILSKYEMIIADEIKETALMRPNIVIDCSVIMPNHVHMIIRIAGAYLPQSQQTSDDAGARSAPLPSSSQTIGAVVNGIKAAASGQIGFSIFQRGYYDRNIRDKQCT